jgi:GTP-binding protein HflX
LFGSGQVEQIGSAAAEAEAELIIIDAPITPIQQRNLETATKAKVIDRTGLILEIFGERAATAEGRLQVELAHLDYQAGRLVRSWTHLERQRGGFGFLGGPAKPRSRPTGADPRPDGEAAQGAGAGDAHALAAPGPAAARALAGDRAGRLHQCRQIDAVQPADQCRRHGREPAVRDARPDHARDRVPGFDKAILSDTVAFISSFRPSSSPPSGRRSRK